MSSRQGTAARENRRGRAPRVNVRRRKPKDGSQQLSGRASSSDDVIPRGKYESDDPDYDTGEMKRLRRYLEETELEVSFHKILGVLLDLPFLPYNPYPGFVRRFRAIAERYAMSKGIQDWEVLRILEIDLQRTLFHDLYLREDHSTEVYGLQTILQGVSPWHLSKYKWLVENVVPNTAALHSKEGYSNQVMVALVGRCVFEGVFYHNVHHVTLRAEHLITGPDANEGIEVFAEFLVSYVEIMEKSKDRHFIGMHVPDQDSTRKTSWSARRIKRKKDEFISRIKEVVEAKQYVEMSCALRLQPEAPAFASATVEFCLNFIEVPDDIDKESTQETYCERPMGTLYDGVFLIRAHAEQYMAALSPILNKDADKIELKVRTSGRMVIDGLTIGGEEDNTGAFSPEIKDPNRKYFRQKLAELDIISDFSDALHYVILLALMEKKNDGDDLVIEAFRMATSSAGRMTGVMEYCKSLRYLVLGMGKQRDEWAAVREEFYRFISTVEETLIDKIHNITIDIKATGQRLQGYIRTILSTDEHAFASIFDVHKTSLLLESLELFCIPAVMVLAESVFDNTPKLKALVDECKNEFPDLVPEGKAGTRTRPDPANSTLSVDVEHGIEPPQLRNFSHDKLVIPAKDIIDQRAEFPKVIEREGLLIQYMIDLHLDDLWHDQLVEFIEAEYFQPNPYPEFISRLREYAMKTDLFFERDSEILERMFATLLHLEDDKNYIYTIAGVDAYGVWSSLAVFDPVTIQAVLQLVQDKFQQTDFVQNKGPYRVGICLALVGSCIWYGKMDPYLNEVELHEHIYIQGPTGGYGQALDLFSEIVYDYVHKIVMENKMPVDGVYFDDVIRFRWEDMANQKSAFISKCLYYTNERKSVAMKAMAILEGHNEWRYVTVKKQFMLHFIHGRSKRPELFFRENPIAIYQSIFLSAERAAFHYQKSGINGDPMLQPGVITIDKGVTQQIKDARNASNWLEVHRLLLMKNLIEKTNDHVGDSWRMLHSMAAMIEYAVSMTDSLQSMTRLMKESLSLYDRLDAKRKDEADEDEQKRVAAMSEKERKKYDKEQAKKKKEEEAIRKKEEEKKRKEEEKKKKEEEKKRKEEEKRKAKEEEEKKKKEEGGFFSRLFGGGKKESEKNEKEKDEKEEEKEDGEEEGEYKEEEVKDEDGVVRIRRRKMKVGEESDMDVFWNIPSPPLTPPSPTPEDDLAYIPRFQVPINEAILGQMTMVYRDLMRDICNSSIVMSSEELKVFIERKLLNIMEVSTEYENLYLAYTDETQETLEKIKHMLKQIQDTIAADVHSISPKAEEAMMRLDSDGRPEVPKPRASPKPRSEGRRSVLSKISERTEDHLSDISENVQEKKTIIDLHYMDV